MRFCAWLGPAIVGLAGFWLKTAFDAGEFKTLRPVGNQACQAVNNVPGPEDMALIGSRVWGTSDERGWMQLGKLSSDLLQDRIGKQVKQGALWTMDLEQGVSSFQWVVMAGFPQSRGRSFHPHGISAESMEEEGFVRLLVVNHCHTGERLEVLEVALAAPSIAKWKVSLSSPLFRNINDVAEATPLPGKDKVAFYITNWLHYEPGTMISLIEMFGQRRWGSLVRCSASLRDFEGVEGALVDAKCETVQDSLGVPNGILRTAAGELLVVNTLGKSLGVYQRDLEAKQPAAAPQAPPLVHVGDLALASGCDNLTENAEGDVLLACHPKSLTFLRHADDHAYPSPSEVLQVRLGDSSGEGLLSGAKVWLKWLSLGGNDLGKGQLSGSSGVALAKGRLVVGAVHASHILVCDGH